MAVRTSKVTSAKVTKALNKYLEQDEPKLTLTAGQLRAIESQFARRKSG